MKKNIICLSTDENYFNYTYNFFKSLKDNFTLGVAACRCVNFNDENKLQKLADLQVDIIVDNTTLSPKKNILKDVGKDIHYTYGINLHGKESKQVRNLLYSEQAVYTCHSRFKNVLHLFEKGYDRVLCLDSDTIVRKNIDHIFSYLDNYDLCTVFGYITDSEFTDQKRTDKSLFFKNEGLLMFRKNDRVNEFIQKIHHIIFEVDGNFKKWNIDSYALENCYNDELKINFIPRLYKDVPGNNDAFIWSGDGVYKYVEEFNAS